MNDAVKKLDTGIVDIHGKKYHTVALRIKEMRADHGEQWAIDTEILQADDDTVRIKATVHDRGRVIATGHAEEKRNASTINQSSALENCETSAVGRALANAGYLGVDVASAEEMEEHRSDAIVVYFQKYLDTVREHWEAINTYKQACTMNKGYDSGANQIMNRRIGEADMRILYKAPSKGSVFSTVERDRAGSTALPDPDAHEHTDNVKMQ